MTLAGWLELQKQILFGDDNKKSKCDGRSLSGWTARKTIASAATSGLLG
jgi:hypothetical protein